MDVEFIKYQYEDVSHETASKKFKFKIGVRHLQLLYMFLICVAMGVLRGSLGITMLAVTDTSRDNDTYIEIKTWDRKTQGVILYSFFMGYAIMLIPGDLFLKRVGGKYTLAVSLLLNGSLCVAMPTVVNKGSVSAVSGMHLFMGMSQACVSPANYALLAKWCTPMERNIFGRIVFMGLLVGIILALPITGMIAESRLGWELIYYSLAMMAFSMGIICVLLTANSPNKHQAVGDTEKEYIAVAQNNLQKVAMERKEMNNQSVANGNLINKSLPWIKILKEPEFWGIALSHTATSIVFVFCLTDIPLYIKNFHHCSIKETGYWMSLLFAIWLTVEILNAIGSSVYDNLVSWNIGLEYWLDIPSKIIFSLGFMCMVSILPILSYLIPNWCNTAIIILAAILASLSLQTHVFMKSVINTRYLDPGNVLMLSGTFASLVGAFIPLLTGFIIYNDWINILSWRYLFYSIMAIVLICQTLYYILTSNCLLSWKRRLSRNHHLIGYDNPSELLEMKTGY